jgi:hypothetical protein
MLKVYVAVSSKLKLTEQVLSSYKFFTVLRSSSTSIVWSYERHLPTEQFRADSHFVIGSILRSPDSPSPCSLQFSNSCSGCMEQTQNANSPRELSSFWRGPLTKLASDIESSGKLTRQSVLHMNNCTGMVKSEDHWPGCSHRPPGVDGFCFRFR